MTTQRLLSYVRRAVDDYKMIDDGDKIAVGISGGKDSLSLLIALKSLQRFYPKKFEIEAITVSLGLPGGDYRPVEKLCQEIGVRYTIVKTEIGPIVFDERKEKNPCSLCSKMRKGALNDKAKKLGCNKVALGHNKDDIMQTLFMSLFYEGRIHTFMPVTLLEKTNLYVIRPLMYVPEADVKSYVKKNDITIVKSPCTVDGHTKREEMKKFIGEQRKKYDHFDDKIFGAIKRSEIQGWKKENLNARN